MATYTTAQMAAAGVMPATASDAASTPGPVIIEYFLDASKKAIAANDVVTFLDIPANTGVVITAATLEVIVAGAATSAIAVGIAGSNVTGLTAFDAATVGKSIKQASGSNSVITTSGTSSLTLQVSTAGLGSGKFRVRIYGDILKA